MRWGKADLSHDRLERIRRDYDEEVTRAELVAMAEEVLRLRASASPGAETVEQGLRRALESAVALMDRVRSALHNGGGTGHEEVRLEEGAAAARRALLAASSGKTGEPPPFVLPEIPVRFPPADLDFLDAAPAPVSQGPAPSLDRCQACSVGVLDSRLGGMCGECSNGPAPGSPPEPEKGGRS